MFQNGAGHSEWVRDRHKQALVCSVCKEWAKLLSPSQEQAEDQGREGQGQAAQGAGQGQAGGAEEGGARGLRGKKVWRGNVCALDLQFERLFDMKYIYIN